MKRYLPLGLLALSIAWTAAGLFPPRTTPDDIDLVQLGKAPVMVGGRIKPLDTVARNSLLIIHGKQTLHLENGREITAIKWLTDTLFNAAAAAKYPAFLIQNGEVLG